MSDRGKIELRFTHVADIPAALKAIRSTTGMSLALIRDSFAGHTTITAAHLYGRDHDDTSRKLLLMLNVLDALATEYVIIVDGKPESRDYLHNILQRHHANSLATQMMTNLEIGEPDIETLRWLKQESPAVFRTTLELILSEDGYNVDAETLTWVKKQLENASPSVSSARP